MPICASPAGPTAATASAGTATITDAAYRESLLTGGLAALFRQQQDVLPCRTAARPPAAPSGLVLDLRVLANDSIVIDTSLARVALGTNLRVAEPISNVRLIGQADIAPGGQLFFGGHTYQIESGIFDFRAGDASARRPPRGAHDDWRLRDHHARREPRRQRRDRR